MRYLLFVLIFILSSLSSAASWQTYQNDLKNSGASNETGYFPLQTANFSDDGIGMDFQPLADDLDKGGSNEIAVFFNGSLIIFNPYLDVLAQAKAGYILGQPALFNFDSDEMIEIIFNARQGSIDYFFAYQYNNSNLQQEFNITLSNEANFSGIKCLSELNSCVFKDKLNYIHIVNMSSKNDSYYNTSVYEESRDSVPAVGDIDNDGSYEAVFWFNEDNSSGYGFLVFDLNNRSLKRSFNHSGIVDNIFSPLILSSLRVHQLYELKGQPVLIDMDNNKKLEIAASVFYDDSRNSIAEADWYTELFVYTSNGTKLFSKCEINTVNNVRCGDGDTQKDRYEGTNPFVMDYDGNGIDDICFTKDVKKFIGIVGFDYMALNCYNHTGDEIAKVKLSIAPDGIKGTAMAADMNNDGKMEIVTSTTIYLQNGTAIFTYQLSDFHPIAVDLDGSKGLDLLWAKGNQTKVFLDWNNYSVDVSIIDSDIEFLKLNNTHFNVSAMVKNNGQSQAGNVKAVIYNEENLQNQTSLFSIRKAGNYTIHAVLELKEGENIAVNVDFDNEINESNEDNNFILKEFISLPYVYVSANLEPFNVEHEFEDYVRKSLISGYYTANEADADVSVYIGKYNPKNQDNSIKTLREFEFGYGYGSVIFNDKVGLNPYAALVGAFNDDGKVKVMIVGNEIEGEIAAAKEFVKNQALLLNVKDKEVVFIGDENADAVKVYDYLHLGGNQEHYGIGNSEFKIIVRNALSDETFNVFDKTVASGNGVTLRLRNLKPNMSSDYLEYLNSTGVPVEMPVVLARGLWSNLTSWETFAGELANIGRDAWLIEITGGPGQDCDTCVDYTFDDLTDDYVPALLNGVLNFTSKDKLQYVGFSNGCRATLSSLEKNKFDSNKVETFVAVGCPGAFEGFDIGASGIKLIDDRINKNLQDKKHISFKDMFITGIFNFNAISKGTEKISMNLWMQYDSWISSNEDKQPGNITVNNFIIIHGNAAGSNDIIVTILDEKHIYNNTKINNTKRRFNIVATHIDLADRSTTKNLIRKSINREELSFLEKNINLIESEEK